MTTEPTPDLRAVQRIADALLLIDNEWQNHVGSRPYTYFPSTARAMFYAERLEAALAATPSEPDGAQGEGRSVPADSTAGLDVERLRLVLHDEYQHDTSGDRYYGCQHKNQHRSTWDCAQRADEIAEAYALSPSTPPETPDTPESR